MTVTMPSSLYETPERIQGVHLISRRSCGNEDMGCTYETQADINNVRGNEIYALTFQNEDEHYPPRWKFPLASIKYSAIFSLS